MLLTSVILVTLLQFWTCWAQNERLTAPLFTSSQTVTSTFYTDTTLRITKRTPCFATSGFVSPCGKKRGIEEEPNLLIHENVWSAVARFQQKNNSNIIPSQVTEAEITAAPSSPDVTDRLPTQLFPISSSFSDQAEEYYYYQPSSFNSFLNRFATDTIIFATLNGNCAGSTVNLSKFLSCLGLMSDVQQVTVTVTHIVFTQSTTLSTGYVPIMTLVGCTPLAFPLLACPSSAVSLSSTAAGGNIP